MVLQRKMKIGFISLVVVSLIGGMSLHFAGRALKAQIEAALGADSVIGSIHLGLFAVTLTDLRIKAPAGWPAAETLRARRIEVSPDWGALFSQRIAVKSIKVEGAYLSLWRTPQGKLRLLPSLLETAKPSDTAPPPEVSIGEVELEDAAVELFDASVQKPAHKVRIEAVNARLEHLQLPTLKGESALEVEGLIKGVKHDGELAIKGLIELASMRSDISTRLRGVDLIALQPYLIKASDAGVRNGSLDLDLKSRVNARHLHAPGKIVLHKLELDSHGSFMGLPRQAAVGALKDGKDDIEVSFVLEGNLDDPKFSLNENLAMRFGAGLADSLGVSIGSLGKSVGSAASSVGGAIKRLFD